VIVLVLATAGAVGLRWTLPITGLIVVLLVGGLLSAGHHGVSGWGRRLHGGV
jgi:hypothetical protein